MRSYHRAPMAPSHPRAAERAPVEGSRAPTLVGRVVGGRFRVVQQLASGAMGVIHEALDQESGEVVALKLHRPDAQEHQARRLEREAEAMSALDTPHVVRVISSGHDQAIGAQYLVMERLRGMDLAALLAPISGLGIDTVLKIGAQACHGLRAAHDAGYLHRDLKPGNLFLSLGRGGLVTVKLVDFGLAKPRDSAQRTVLTAIGEVVGTPLYLSPEQARGDRDIDPRSDVFSLGIVLVRCLLGRPPRDLGAGLLPFLEALCSEQLPPLCAALPHVPPEVARVIDRCTRLEPAARYPSAAALLAELLALVETDALHTQELREHRPTSGTLPAVRIDDGETTRISTTPPITAEQTWRLFREED